MADENGMKNELKKDFLGRQIVLTVARASRPHEHAKPRVQKVVPAEKCFFCPGNESLTPPELDRIGEGGKWEVRVFPNKFPAFTKQSPKAYGAHEVIVETPDHQKTLSELSEENLSHYLSMLKKRMLSAAEDPKIRYSAVFKNEGGPAGASLEHSHTQLVAMDNVPKYVQRLGKKSKSFAKMGKSQKATTFHSNEHFFSFCPKVSRFPLEIWIVPHQHLPSLADMEEGQLRSLANSLKASLTALDSETGFGPYNIVFHSAPTGDKNFWFHLEILPRMANWAGFELGTEIIMTSSIPKQSAKIFKKAIV